MTRKENAENVEKFVGGELCLDFANAVDWPGSTNPVEWISTYEDLVSWSTRAGVLEQPQAQLLRTKAAGNPAEAEVTFKNAVSFRRAVYRIFSAVVDKEKPSSIDMKTLNVELKEARSHMRISAAEKGFRLEWVDSENSLGRMLWPIAVSAAELLISENLKRVRKCATKECSWLFLDRSRNRSRRWCNMQDCGNKAKARRHYRRKVAQKSLRKAL